MHSFSFINVHRGGGITAMTNPHARARGGGRNIHGGANARVPARTPNATALWHWTSIHTQDVSSSPFTLSQTDQIPFFFCAIPYHLVDDDVFPQLKGNHIKLLLVIDRYRNLKLKQRKFDQQLISGWTIPVSQQVLADRCGVKIPSITW